MTNAAILWRRLDTPGHDACRLEGSAVGWQLDGTSVFAEQSIPARLSYQVSCDLAWHTQRGHVRGWIGPRSLEFTIARTARGGWTLNGDVIPGVDGCIDLDLGFTPATNLVQLRRLGLSEGGQADAPAAWLDVASGKLEALLQRYQRRSASTYWYEAPRFDYRALLEVTDSGFVRRYPGLWEAES